MKTLSVLSTIFIITFILGIFYLERGINKEINRTIQLKYKTLSTWMLVAAGISGISSLYVAYRFKFPQTRTLHLRP